MTPSERKFLFVLVREVLRRADGSDEIEPKRHGDRRIAMFQSRGYLRGRVLTRTAFLEFLDTFERAPCPAHIQDVVDSFGLDGLHWRRPKGVILERIEWAGGGGIAYRNFKTLFIKEGASEPS
jgi:hypothetical protein